MTVAYGFEEEPNSRPAEAQCRWCGYTGVLTPDGDGFVCEWCSHG